MNVTNVFLKVIFVLLSFKYDNVSQSLAGIYYIDTVKTTTNITSVNKKKRLAFSNSDICASDVIISP